MGQSFLHHFDDDDGDHSEDPPDDYDRQRDEGTNPADLSVNQSNLFQTDLRNIHPPNRDRWGLNLEGQIYRHAYHYYAEYPRTNEKGESDTGVIELRARIWLTSTELPDVVKSAVRNAAHRAAYIFDSSIETGAYSGYLSGFTQDANLTAKPDWERAEPDDGGTLGKVDWNVEIWDEQPRLRGIAQGVANIWRLVETETGGETPEQIAPHRWDVTGGPSNRTDGRYQVAPEGGTDARRRYKTGAGNGKKVYINGHLVGRTGARGRVFVSNEYAHGNPTHGDNWSRRGILDDDDDATPQAFRHGGTLYMTGETPTAVHLSTSRALPPGFKAADADQVAVDQEVTPGSDPGIVRTLEVRGASSGDPTIVQCRRDEQITNALGRSSPSYTHEIATGWRA